MSKRAARVLLTQITNQDGLSPNAAKLFVAIKNLMMVRGVNFIWLSNRAACNLATVSPLKIETAQDILIKQGLFTVCSGHNPNLDPSDVQHKYTFVEREAEALDTQD